ncbi:hypothetical protein PROFUN_00582 [Planoprotostelium fungivorum]|uniref:Uncharacterized protein n=1 Tax=Planoprotostelium fungivorum TaxID=1890364 RepID=A0A2P6N1B7_9EUKA|nr:hypothetical protein PROFUN_00582 [Planoprotostelium fungivorum]
MLETQSPNGYHSEEDSEDEGDQIEEETIHKLQNLMVAMARKAMTEQTRTKRPQPGEKYETFDESKIFHYLDVPKAQRNWMLSPPPSPPQGWKPFREAPNMIPFVDLDPVQVDGQTILLENVDQPKITISCT